MNSSVLINILRFVLLVLAQELIFNNLNLKGWLNPYPYIIFIFLYPVNANQKGLLLASFFLGLTLDLFANSGGVHACASLILAYIRPVFFKFAFGLSYEYQTIKLNDRISPDRLTFIFLCVITHHFLLFTFEFFKFTFIIDILIRTIATTIFTFIVSIILMYLFKTNKK